MFYRKKVILSVAVFAFLSLSISAFAFTLAKDSKGNLLSWNINSMPIRYRIHIDNMDDKSAESRVRAVIRAFESWELRMLSLVSFKYEGLTQTDKAIFDGINLITWVDNDWQYNRDTVAYTTLWITEAGTILEADIELNAEYFEWSADGDPFKMDIHNVLSHEVGHLIGIEHSIESTNLSMFPIVGVGEVRKRVVKRDDISAAVFLYPVVSADLNIFEFPSENLMDELVFAERLHTNYSELNKENNILTIAGIRINSRGDAGIAALVSDSDNYLLGIYSQPGKPEEDILAVAGSSLDMPDVFIKDITALDIDGDELDEIAVLSVDSLSNHALYIYDTPLEGTFDSDLPQKWIARDLWRVPDISDNLMLFSLDLDGDGRRELATLSYAMDGVYVIKSYTPPSRFDDTNENALARGEAIKIPFTISGAILDVDCIDIDGDGVSELVALVKGEFGYTVRIMKISIPSFADEVQEFQDQMTMSVLLEKGEYPVALSVINGTDMGKPKILITIAKSNQ